MINSLFVLTLAAGFTLLLAWSFKTLPGERWQIIASVPVAKEAPGRWRGVNLTFYGLLTANAYGAAVAVLFVLLGSVSVPLWSILVVVAFILMLCVPASKLIARVVEKKSYTFTVGGASFVGIVLAPWVITFIRKVSAGMVDIHIPMMPALAALSISYALGEGIGRLACISFGCCYGKPLSRVHPILRRIFENHSFIFFGKTKKIAYASGMDGEKVIPVQAITSVLYIAAALIGIHLFLHSHFPSALILTVVITQGWRAFSELLRADYRGEGIVSAYQIMGVIAIVYSLTLPMLFPSEAIGPPDLMAGLGYVWNPTSLLFLYALRLAIFLYTGRSMVTGSTLSFHVNGNRI